MLVVTGGRRESVYPPIVRVSTIVLIELIYLNHERANPLATGGCLRVVSHYNRGFLSKVFLTVLATNGRSMAVLYWPFNGHFPCDWVLVLCGRGPSAPARRVPTGLVSLVITAFRQYTTNCVK